MSARETILIACLAVAAIAAPLPASAQQTCTPRPVALFESVRNSVQVVQASTRASISAARQVQVCAGDTIQVGDDSRAVLLMLQSNTPLVIEQNSVFVVTETATDTCRGAGPTSAGTFVELVRGALLFITRVRRSVEICTPFVNAAIEGTEFVVRVQADRTLITVFEGSVRATNAMGMVVVGPGQQAVAVQNQAPQIQVIARPRDAVQWALYYEPILPSDTLQKLEVIPEAARDATYYVRRASVRLEVGQLDEARSDLDQAQKLDPSNGNAYALRAIVDVALNDQEGALSNARMAVERAPQSASAQLALSYALQANLQLEAARDAALRATELEPANAGALARLAEVRLMLDDVGGAVRAARDAVQRSPQVARAQVVLGFTLLAQLKPSQAREAFQRAIDLEPDNPLARLGTGLTRIRQGDLAEGRADLELAMALNPDDSLIRSYLGKAYFDEKREPLPAEQFEQAKQLGPQDPTPWFYDAIRKQTLNRPIEGLRDLERSIELNDNRAVYRSRFLLDHQDLGARSASLGRLYRDLGFEERGLLEGWKSVQADDTDHSGHRFLADTYSALPRHEVARVSELLQAQLLQPLSLTPVPPRLAETNLFILEGAGPDELAFNEFNPLFNRNRVVAQVSGVVGQNDVLGDEAIVAGVMNRVSFSVGQFHYATDGFRPNNFQDRDILNGFGQLQISKSTSIQGEVRFENSSTGDLTLLFFPDDFSPNRSLKAESELVRVGLRHTFSPRSVLIASLYRQDLETVQTERVTTAGIDTQTRTSSDIRGWTGEVRHLFRVGRVAVSSGFGRFESESNIDDTLSSSFPFPPFRIERPSTSTDERSHTNAYVYPEIFLPYNLTVTSAVSADFYRTPLLTLNKVNPKVGVLWNPTHSTTIRLASFKGLQRSLVSNQTIEPTHVAGFNQFFNEAGGTDARRHGVGIDQRVRRDVFVGAEYTWRTLRVPVRSNIQGAQVIQVRREEQLGRAYASWLVHQRWSVNANYLYERFDREPDPREHFSELRTHRLPLEVRYFAPAGPFASFGATRIFQRGLFGIARQRPGEDRFWVVDASVGFRIPRRFGRFAIEMNNLFDEQFNFQDTDPASPVVRPGRLVVFSFTVGT